MVSKSRVAAIIIVTIIIILIVIFMFHINKLNNEDAKGGRVHVSGTYVVTTGPKTQRNPYYGMGSNYCFYLNQIETPSITLKRGVYYEFKNESNEALYFCTSPSGGPSSPGSLSKNSGQDFKGLCNGIIFFQGTEDLPDHFYYQSGDHEYMGGEIKLI